MTLLKKEEEAIVNPSSSQWKKVLWAIGGIISKITSPVTSAGKIPAMEKLVWLTAIHRGIADITKFTTENITPTNILEFINFWRWSESLLLLQQKISSLPVSLKIGLTELFIAIYAIKVNAGEASKWWTLSEKSFENEVTNSTRAMVISCLLAWWYYAEQFLHQTIPWIRPLDLLIFYFLWQDSTTYPINNYKSRATQFQQWGTQNEPN